MIFKIINDQKREKLRIKLDFVLSTKTKKIQPNRGKNMRDNNIGLKLKKILSKSKKLENSLNES